MSLVPVTTKLMQRWAPLKPVPLSPRSDLSFVQPARLRDSLVKWLKSSIRRPRQRSPGPSLGDLTYDVALEVFLHLDVPAVLVMAKVSRFFSTISNSLTVWRNLATLVMSSGRPLVLDGFPLISDLSVAELRRSVLRTVTLGRMWNREKPKRVASAKPIKLDFPVSECLCYIVKFKNYLLPPTRDGRLLGWDVGRNIFLGTYEIGREISNGGRSSGLIFSGRVHYTTRSLYYIVSGGIVSGEDMRFYVLHIQFPKDNEPSRIEYQPVADFALPYSHIIEMHILDVERRMLCVVLLCPSTKNLTLYVVFDWESHEFCLTSTGITYHYRKTIIGLRLSEDGGHIILRSESDGNELVRSYVISDLRSGSSISNGLVTPWKLSHVARPKTESAFFWSDSAQFGALPPVPDTQPLVFPTADTFAYRVWNMLPWWPTLPGVPFRTSTVVLYLNTQPAAYRWRIAQHFATDAGPCLIPNPTKSGSGSANAGIYKRWVVALQDPVIVPFGDDGVPILGLAYNHVGWIEQVDGWRRGRRVKKRVARLASFPTPGHPSLTQIRGRKEHEGAEDTRLCVKTLDIPERVLNMACHLIVDSSSATVSITTRSNELYTYRYA